MDEVCEAQINEINLARIAQQLVVELNTDIQMCQPIQSTTLSATGESTSDYPFQNVSSI